MPARHARESKALHCACLAVDPLPPRAYALYHKNTRLQSYEGGAIAIAL